MQSTAVGEVRDNSIVYILLIFGICAIQKLYTFASAYMKTMNANKSPTLFIDLGLIVTNFVET